MALWKQLMIYVGELDCWHHQHLYTALIETACRRKLTGATATRAIYGFGKNHIMHTTNSLDAASESSDMPIMVTIIDQEAAIAEFLPVVQEMVKGGLVTLQTIEVPTHEPSAKK